jgi:F5/8 type C domain
MESLALNCHPTHRSKFARLATLVLFLFCLSGSAAFATDRILFIRGGDGTGGFLEGGSDDHLCDIDNFNLAPGNHGWASLASLLRGEGYVVRQIKEGPTSSGADLPVDLANLDLSPYRLVVFGSNNATYGAQAVNKIEAYVRGGGAALFISDANFGSNWGDASNSDQPFLARFGLIMNQDNGTYSLDRSASDYLVANHPIFAGVNSFDGEGVSPISIDTGANPAGVTRTILARAKQQVRLPNGTNQGSTRAANANDGSLVIAEAGSGRIAGHFDRNTFFNIGGAGTDITRLDNRIYARNLFAWLTERTNTGRLDRAGWTATASTPANANNPIVNAFDSNVFTRWATGQPQATGQLFTIDMQQTRRFNRIVLEAGPDQSDYPRGFEILTSNDAVNWVTVIAGARANATNDIDFVRQNARYLRIRQTGSAASNWWSIAEVNVFDTPVDGVELDVDGNGFVEPEFDGLLALRHMLGLTGDALTQGALGVGATRTTGVAIASYLEGLGGNLDLDGDSVVRTTTDGVILARYLRNVREAAMTANATNGSARTLSQITTQLHTLSSAAP